MDEDANASEATTKAAEVMTTEVPAETTTEVVTVADNANGKNDTTSGLLSRPIYLLIVADFVKAVNYMSGGFVRMQYPDLDKAEKAMDEVL